MRVLVIAAVLSIVSTVSAVVPASAATTVVALEGASPDGAAMSLGAPDSVVSAYPIQAPFITYGVDTGTVAAPVRRLSVPYFTMVDGDPYTYAQKDSIDGGATFQNGTYHGAAVAIDDGRLFAWDTYFADLAAGPVREMNIQYWSAADGTWSTPPRAAVDVSPYSVAQGSNFFPISVIQVPGGPMLMGGYAVTPGGLWNGYLMQSTDSGASWTLRSVVGLGDATHYYSEIGLALNATGELVAVIRSEDRPAKSYYKLKIRRSTNLGASWETTTPVDLPAAFDARIMPRLSLLPNGILVLVGGRPNNWIAVSYAGDGRTWDHIGTFYENYPPGLPADQLNYGSGGNASLAWTESNRVLLTADTCHVVWQKVGDPAVRTQINNCTRDGHESPVTTPGVQRVLADVLRRGVGKIDLASKYRAGTVQVQSSLDYTSPAHPRTGAAAAFDGSTEQWSSAIAAGTTQGTFDLTLDRAYTLNRIGLSQSIGHLQSTLVQTKLNASDPWSDWFTAGPRKSYALTHYEPTPRQARYVRLVTGSSAGCLPGVGANCSVLNELELYSTVDSFENDPLSGAQARGWVTKETVVDGAGRIGCWVTQNTAGSGSSRALLITDTYTDHLPTTFAKAPAATNRTIEFRARATRLPATGGALLFSVRNTTALTFTGSELAYHLAIHRDGSISYYTAGSNWAQVAPPDTVNLTAWNTITVQLTTTVATVSVNGTVVGTASRTDGDNSALYGPQLSTSSTAGAGAGADEQYTIDDVLIS